MKIEYVNHVTFHQGTYEIQRVNKKPDSALLRLRVLENLAFQTKDHAEKVHSAAKEIFERYFAKSHSLLGRMISLIQTIMKKCFGIKSKREEAFLEIKRLRDEILKKSAHFSEKPKQVEQKEIPLPEKLKAVTSISRPFLKEVIDLKQQYNSNHHDEIQRLRNTGIYNPDLESLVDSNLTEIEKVKTHIEPKGNQLAVKVALGRALEIKRLMSSTHYVFTHSQDTRWLVVVYLIKELVKQNYEKEKIRRFKFLRVPSQKETKVDALKNKNIHDHQWEIRDELISADAYLLNLNRDESALNFLSRNYSVVSKGNKPDAIIDCAWEIIQRLIPNRKRALQVKSQVVKYINEINIANMGALHIICVPKKLAQSPETNFQFRAHPYGKPCDCSQKKSMDEFTLLELLQNDVMIEEFHCDSYQEGNKVINEKIIPQYRLLSSHMKPEKDVLIMTETPLCKAKRREIKAEIRAALTATC